jgi:hypothetical protein
MRKMGKVSPSKAAKLLGVHVHTVQDYCRKAVSGEPSKLKNVERNPVTGYYWVDIEEVNTLKKGPR